MKWLQWPAALGMAALLLCSADAAPKEVEALVGRYAFDVDRKGGGACTITLTGEGRNGEYGFAIDDACRRAFPFLDTLRSWSPRGLGMAFTYRVGGIAMEFSTVGLTDYSGRLKQGRETTYYMMARYPDRAEDMQKLRDNLAAKWLLWARPEDGAPNCEIRLVARPEPRVDVPAECAAVVPAAAQAWSWTLGHPWGIALLDKSGATILRFDWRDYGGYGTPNDGPALTRIYGS